MQKKTYATDEVARIHKFLLLVSSVIMKIPEKYSSASYAVKPYDVSTLKQARLSINMWDFAFVFIWKTTVKEGEARMPAQLS